MSNPTLDRAYKLLSQTQQATILAISESSSPEQARAMMQELNMVNDRYRQLIARVALLPTDEDSVEESIEVLEAVPPGLQPPEDDK
jgi:hypothetical protein